MISANVRIQFIWLLCVQNLYFALWLYSWCSEVSYPSVNNCAMRLTPCRMPHLLFSRKSFFNLVINCAYSQARISLYSVTNSRRRSAVFC